MKAGHHLLPPPGPGALAAVSTLLCALLFGSDASAQPLLSESALAADFDGVVHAFVSFQDELIIGGTFTHIDGVEVNGVARWRNGAWGPLVGQNEDQIGVYAQDFIPWVSALGTFDGLLFVGGTFRGVGGVEASNIAAWNGDEWTPLDEGVDGRVRTLTEWNNSLLVGGGFVTAGINPARNIAYWTGTSWFNLGEGLIGGVWDAATYKGSLYVGGTFGSTGDHLPAGGVARWQHAWNQVGGGLGGGTPLTATFDLMVYRGELIAAGSFTRAGGNEALQVAAWDGAKWRNLDTGLGGLNPLGVAVFAVAEFDGALIAGGDFDFGSGQVLNSIAWWSGTKWRPLHQGMNASVYSLFVEDGRLIVGGSFTEAFGLPATGLAEWPEGGVPLSVEPQPTEPSVAALPAAFVLHAVHPNPVADAALIRFRLPRAGAYRLQVFDVRGRMIRGWDRLATSAGEGELRWNGLNAAGDRPPRGTYLLELRQHGQRRTQKMILR